MPTPPDLQPTKPIGPDLQARLDRMARIRSEMMLDASMLAEGRRLVNRPGHADKQDFIDDFLKQDKIESYPHIESDIVSDQNSSWHCDLDPARIGIESVTASELEASFALVGAEVPAISHWMARTILRSDAGVERGTLAEVPLSELSVAMTLAHLESLGYQWPKRVTMSVARRVTMILLNRRRFTEPPWHLDTTADEWEQNR